MITTDVSTLKIHKLSKEQYERELAAGGIDENALYLTPDEEYYTEAEIDGMIAAKADKDHNHNTLYYTKDEMTSKLDSKVPATRKINGISLTDDITLTASNVGAYTAADVDKKLGNYLKLSGGTLSGNLTVSGSAAPILKLQSSGSDSSKMLPEITLERPGFSSWKILNKQGVFVIQNNYTTSVQSSYFDVLTLNYNSGDTVIKGTVAATAFVGKLTGNADTATTATKLGSTTVGSGTKLIYLNAGTATASSSTVGSSTKPVYMNAGTITECGNSLGVSITGNAATATKATQDSAGNNIRSTYVSKVSVKNSTVSYEKGDGTTGTIIDAMTETEINTVFTAVFG